MDSRPQQPDSQDGGGADEEAAIALSGSSSTKVCRHVAVTVLSAKPNLLLLVMYKYCTLTIAPSVQLEAVVRRLLFLTRHDPGAKVTSCRCSCSPGACAAVLPASLPIRSG